MAWHCACQLPPAPVAFTLTIQVPVRKFPTMCPYGQRAVYKPDGASKSHVGTGFAVPVLLYGVAWPVVPVRVIGERAQVSVAWQNPGGAVVV
jgi:hypothetical protein